MLKDDCASELRVHLANSLPLPSDANRPRIDLIVFVINLHSKHSLQKVEESLNHVDSRFFLGKVCFLATGAERESHCSIHRNTVIKLAHTYRSPLLFCDLKHESYWYAQPCTTFDMAARIRTHACSALPTKPALEPQKCICIGGELSSHHGPAPGTHAADLRWPRARCLSAEPAVLAEVLRQPPVQGVVSTAALPACGSSSVSKHCW
nr:centromere protein M isoform X2 [Myodes glareolus]